MIKVICKKRVIENWLVLKEMKKFRFRGVLYHLYTHFRKKQGYEIEEIGDK